MGQCVEHEAGLQSPPPGAASRTRPGSCWCLDAATVLLAVGFVPVSSWVGAGKAPHLGGATQGLGWSECPHSHPRAGSQSRFLPAGLTRQC